MHTLQFKQEIPISREQAWGFLSDPKNLQTITPEKMDFKILSGADRPMYSGQIIEYRVTPFSGFKLKWITEITHVKEGSFFVDEQRYGPYKFWHHKHFIHDTGQGVIIEDLINYIVPGGIFGKIINTLHIESTLKNIFEYRREKLSKLFASTHT